MQNPSCLLYGPGDARFENIALPSIEDPHDVIIRIAYVGVSEKDVCNNISIFLFPSPFRSICKTLLVPITPPK